MSKSKPRRARKQAQRRLKRTVLQNHMVLRGWVPVVDGGWYGIAHFDTGVLVIRRRPEPTYLARQSKKHTRWVYTSTHLGVTLQHLRECSWQEMQGQWIRGLRAVAIERGWL